jgi:hypothetical protein
MNKLVVDLPVAAKRVELVTPEVWQRHMFGSG